MKQYALTLVIIGFLSVCSLQAQVLPSFGGSRAGTTGMQFLKIGVDARSSGLGGNFAALANDVAALYWNPAGIARIDSQRAHIQFGHTLYFADIGISYGGAVVRVGESYWGFSVVSLGSGDMDVTTEFQPFGTGETFQANNTALGITYAKALTDQFAFGVTGRWARESIAGINTNNAIFDFGFQYNVGLMNTRFAVTIQNFGVNVQPNGELTVLKFTGPTTVTNFEEISVPAMFRIGLAFDPYVDEVNRITGTVQLNHPTDNNETFGIGAEYSWKNILYGRMGYEFGVDETGLPAFGVGLNAPRNFGYLRLDYGFNNKSRLGSVHRFTLGLGLF